MLLSVAVALPQFKFNPDLFAHHHFTPTSAKLLPGTYSPTDKCY